MQFKKGDVVWLKDRSGFAKSDSFWKAVIHPGEWCTVLMVSSPEGCLWFSAILGWFDASLFTLVNPSEEEKLPKIKLNQGEKYTHPRWSTESRPFFFFVAEYPVKKGEVYGAIQYPDGGRFDLLNKEVDECKPYKEPTQFVRYFNVYKTGVSSTYGSRAEAHHNSGGGCIGRKKVVFTEGEWDE